MPNIIRESATDCSRRHLEGRPCQARRLHKVALSWAKSPAFVGEPYRGFGNYAIQFMCGKRRLARVSGWSTTRRAEKTREHKKSPRPSDEGLHGTVQAIYCIDSNSPAAPMPVPMHMVTMP